MAEMIQLYYSQISRQKTSIFVVWLFHLSGIIGISIGFDEWFMTKTPLNLSVIFVLLLLSFSYKDLKFWFGMVLFFVGGMLVEWLGVQYGFFFGNYEYGNNLGPKLDGVPWFIGINWALLTFITGLMATYFLENKIGRVLLGAGLMVFLDLFLEVSAPVFDFWQFENGVVPLQNYIAWFGFSVLFHMAFNALKLKGDGKLACHLYGAQLLFFVYFFILGY